MAENNDSTALPPGWDRKFDHRTGRYYFINYFNKTTTWEDPRHRYRQLVQPVQQHMTPTSVIESIPLQDLTNVRPSPMAGRAVGSHAGTHVNLYASPARTAETTMTTETEQSVAKINAVFPTVSDTHIRALLMKYLKSVFPKVEETLLLDILANSDNNVQKATEKLISMGFEKRDTPPPRLTMRKKEEEQQRLALERSSVAPTPPPRMKSLEEKQKMKGRLQEKYPDIPQRVVTIALDSVDFDEDRANQILTIMVQEEETKTKVTEPETVKESQPEETRPAPQLTVEPDITLGPSPVHKPSTKKTSEKPEKAQHRRPKGKKDIPKVSRGTSTTEDKEYKSPYLIKVCGPNRDLYKGPNDELLLVDYVTWNGPNIDLLSNGGRVSLAKGPDKSLLQERSYKARGPNSDLRKGPMRGLSKGSIYSQLTSNDASDESRGK